MNPNHPHYGALGGGPNLNLLDNMLMAAGFQATDQPRPALVPQYTYAQDVASMHHHAMNLVQPHTTVAASDPVHVIVYQQNEHQQQPISYKIPQLGTTVISQDQNFVVNEQGGQLARQQNVTSQPNVSRAPEPPVQAVAAARHVQSPAERKKDIVAQAMQEQKIFEESGGGGGGGPKAEPVVKQEPGVSSAGGGSGGVNNTAAANSSTATTAANSSVTTTGAAGDTKPVVTATKTTPSAATTPGQRRPYQRTNSFNRQQIMPRLQILDDEDDGLTCRLCLASYWYKAEIQEHLKTVHSIADPEKYEREEREKKTRRIREEQQRILLAKKQREERERRLREAKFGRGRGGGPGTIKLTSPGARPTTQSPGQRPSFQYRDGAFICDLCKESFSDGNDMVTHWKSHVKKQQADAAKSGRGVFRGGRGGRGSRGRGRGRGRHSYSDEGGGRRGRGGSSDEDDADSDDESPKKGKGKGKKGMPRWTAYLLWSTRKRRDVVVDHPDWSFAQIAKWISDEWKKIDADEKDELQKEAEEMNELGIRKLPRDDDGPDPDKDTTDEDSDFEEGYRRKTKPIMLKIKKERSAGKGKDDEDSEESDWEPEAEVMPPEREQTRSGRQRKRPSFFQEFESQENNLDSILEQFEKEQAQEFGKPKPPKPEPKPAGERKPRKRRIKSPPSELAGEEEIDVEVETLRSGRKRKVRRIMTQFMDGSDEDERGKGASSDDDDFEPPPEEEVEKLEEKDDQIDDDEELLDEELEDEEEEDDDRLRHPDDTELPPKKRGRPKKIMTDEEIEEATKAAIGAKPVIEITRVPKNAGDEQNNGEKEKGSGGKDGEDDSKDGEEEDEEDEEEEGEEGAEGAVKKTARKSAKTSQQENEGFKVKPTWVNETLSDSEGEDGAKEEKTIKSEPAEGGQAEKDGEEKAATGARENSNVPEAASSGGGGGEQEKAATEAAAPSTADDTQTTFVNSGDGGAASFDGAAAATDMETEDAASSGTALDSGGAVDPMGGEGGEAEKSTTAEAVVPLPEDADNNLAGDSLEQQRQQQQPAVADTPMTDEDLLTGPAHNLDDSQYKPDIVDPNLDDIFK